MTTFSQATTTSFGHTHTPLESPKLKLQFLAKKLAADFDMFKVCFASLEKRNAASSFGGRHVTGKACS